MKQSNINIKISFTIRTIGSSLKNLENVIQSIANNNYYGTEIVVVYQGSEIDVLQNIEKIFVNFPEISFQLIHNNTSKDERSKNLNLGVKAAKGRFIAFLDDDDEIMPGFIASFTSKLENSNNAWGFCKTLINKNGKCYLQKKIKKFSYMRLLIGNYISIHAIVFDTSKFSKKEIIFDENITAYEDYLLLLNLSKKYKPLFVNEILCIYNKDDTAKYNNYFVNKAYMEKQKIELVKTLPIWQQMWYFILPKKKNKGFITKLKKNFYLAICFLPLSEKLNNKMQNKIFKYSFALQKRLQ